jgi:DOPA 4,5-dioxygenase
MIYISSRPHPLGSWGIYIPLNQLTETISFISMYHGNLTVLVHPNSGRPKIDHLLNAFWIKSIFQLDGNYFIKNSIFIFVFL